MRKFGRRFYRTLALYKKYPVVITDLPLRPPPAHISVNECPGCAEIRKANIRHVIARRCSVCSRPITEVAREHYLVERRKESLAR